jgi:hypothetical protein
MVLGIPPENLDPLRYAGPKLSLIPTVQAKRAPTVLDTKYPLFTIWRTEANATDGAGEGEYWYLSKFDTSGDAIWIKLTAGGTGPLISVETDDGAPNVVPDGAGALQILGGAGIDVTGQGPGNTVTVSLTGGGAAIDQIAVDANTAPGTDPVVPDASGQVTVSGAAVAAHSVPIETHSRAANAYNIEVQLGSAVAPTPANSNDAGILSANTNQFDVDATSGMFSLKGSTTAAPVLTLSDDANNAVGPDANGDIGILGGTNIATTAAGNDVTVAIDGIIAETNGGTGTGTYTTGDILYSDASNSLAKLPIGSAGELLTVSGGIPAWSGSAGGTSGWQFISSATASTSASIEFTSGIDSTYDLYMITVIDMVAQTGGTDFSLRSSTDGGSTWDSGATDYLGTVMLGVTAGALTQNASGDRLRLTARTVYLLDNTAANAVSGQIFIYSPSNGSGKTCFSSVMILPQRSGGSGETAFCSVYGGGIRNSAADVDAIQLFISSGNITSGTFALYGLSTS